MESTKFWKVLGGILFGRFLKTLSEGFGWGFGFLCGVFFIDWIALNGVIEKVLWKLAYLA